MKADLRLTWKWELQVSCLDEEITGVRTSCFGRSPYHWITPHAWASTVNLNNPALGKMVMNLTEFGGKMAFEHGFSLQWNLPPKPKTTLKNAATSWRLWGSFVLVGSSWIILICLSNLLIKWCKVHSQADIDLSYANSSISALRPKRGLVSTYFGSKAFERNRCVVRN